MKKIIQLWPGDQHPEWIQGWRKWSDKLILLDNPEEANPEIPFVFGGNIVSKWVRNWLKLNRPCFVLGRPYLGGHLSKKRTSWRVAVNSFACTELKNIPYSRWHTIGLDKQPWKVKEIQNVLIAPPKKTLYFWEGILADAWSEKIKLQFPNANVKIRLKEGMGGKGKRYVTLWDDLNWADLVISYSSAITTEAFWYGKKVISPGVCPTWVSCERDFVNWQNPIEPISRSVWHEHTSWIQFTEEEWGSGDAQEMTVQYQGWPLDVQAVDNKFFE
jgi:hypothetical protein